MPSVRIALPELPKTTTSTEGPKHDQCHQRDDHAKLLSSLSTDNVQI